MSTVVSRATGDATGYFDHIRLGLQRSLHGVRNVFTQLSALDTSYADIPTRGVHLTQIYQNQSAAEMPIARVFDNPIQQPNLTTHTVDTIEFIADKVFDARLNFTMQEMDQMQVAGGLDAGRPSAVATSIFAKRLGATIAGFVNRIDLMHYHQASMSTHANTIVNTIGGSTGTKLEEIAGAIKSTLNQQNDDSEEAICLIHPSLYVPLLSARVAEFNGAVGSQRFTNLPESIANIFTQGFHYGGVRFISSPHVPLVTVDGYPSTGGVIVTPVSGNNRRVVLANATGTSGHNLTFRYGDLVSFTGTNGATTTVSLVRPTGVRTGSGNADTSATSFFADATLLPIGHTIDFNDGTNGNGTAEFEIAYPMTNDQLPASSGANATNPYGVTATAGTSTTKQYYRCLAFLPNSYTIFMRNVNNGFPAEYTERFNVFDESGNRFSAESSSPVKRFGYSNIPTTNTYGQEVSNGALRNVGGWVINGIYKGGSTPTPYDYILRHNFVGITTSPHNFHRLEVAYDQRDMNWEGIPEIF